MTDYLIWWTNQSDVERVEYLGLDGQLGHWPKYLKDEFASRNGRAGRGRLWVLAPFHGHLADWPLFKSLVAPFGKEESSIHVCRLSWRRAARR